MVNRGPLRVTVVGDTTLDVIVRGAAPIPGRDQPARIQAGPGGQGANVAVRLARAGAHVQLVTAIGADAAGRELETILAAEGVTLVRLPAARSGIVVSLVDAAGERAMLSDRAPFDGAGLAAPGVRAAVADADWIHLSGYPLADPGSGGPLAELAGSRGAGQRCSIGGGSFQPGSDVVDRVRQARPDVVLFDRSEATAVLGLAIGPRSDRATSTLATDLATRLGAVAVVTDGAAGAVVANAEGSSAVSTERRSVVDATGAGDAHAAAVILALAPGSWPPSLETLRSALEGAARVGAEVAGAVGAQAAIPAEARS